jgi:hypothetical protein
MMRKIHHLSANLAALKILRDREPYLERMKKKAKG